MQGVNSVALRPLVASTLLGAKLEGNAAGELRRQLGQDVCLPPSQLDHALSLDHRGSSKQARGRGIRRRRDELENGSQLVQVVLQRCTRECPGTPPEQAFAQSADVCVTILDPLG